MRSPTPREQMLTERKLDGAVKMFNTAGQIYAHAEGAESPDVAMCLDRLGTIAEDVGKHDDAESLHKRALAILQKVDGPDSLACHACARRTGENLQGSAAICRSRADVPASS